MSESALLQAAKAKLGNKGRGREMVRPRVTAALYYLWAVLLGPDDAVCEH